MPVFELIKKILNRNDWVLAVLKDSNGNTQTFGGKYGCEISTMIAGQQYIGKITSKRGRDGKMKKSFIGTPQSRPGHALKAALEKHGVKYRDRTMLFSIKPLNKLITALQNKSDVISQLPNIGNKKLANIFAAFESVSQQLDIGQSLSKTLPSLLRYLNRSQTDALLKWHGNKMEDLLAFLVSDPWRLIYDKEFDCFGFENQTRNDFLAATKPKSRQKMVQLVCQDLKIFASLDPRSKRCQAIDTIRKYMASSGSYWMPVELFQRDFSEIKQDWPIVIEGEHLALNKFSQIETFLSQTFRDMMANYEQPEYSDPPEEACLDAEQREAVSMACQLPLFILSGGAGTGKTSVCKYIVDSLPGILLASPTGKAAQRMTELTGKTASTIHRLAYKVEPEESHTLLIDEASMLEPEILAKLLKKQSFNKIIFVGDLGQLESISPGNFYSDISNSEIPQKELVKIYRNDSLIATNGKKIRERNGSLDTDSKSFEIIPYTNDEAIIKTAETIFKSSGELPIVLCNTNAEICGLNKKLRQIHNPRPSSQSDPCVMDYSNGVWRYDAFRFGTGDNVINIVNKYGQDNDDNIFLQVANGEIGIVMHAKGTKVTVQFPTNLVEFDIQEEKSLRPAYALTVHKSQGSEYANVIVKCKFTFGDNRKRFYTATTRAQQKCIVFEVGNSIERSIRSGSFPRITKIMK
jgi:hypothetical protein